MTVGKALLFKVVGATAHFGESELFFVMLILGNGKNPPRPEA